MLTKGLALKSFVTAERIRELLHYDPATGLMTRLVAAGGGTKPGEVAGNPTGYGYMQVMVDGHNYLVHRLVWLHVYGVWPKHFIDHINGNGMDNRIFNLREASQAQNLQNVGIRSTNKSGFPGVSWDAARCKWRAQITHNMKNIALGRFDSAEDASCAYLQAKARLHTFNPDVRAS